MKVKKLIISSLVLSLFSVSMLGCSNDNKAINNEPSLNATENESSNESSSSEIDSSKNDKLELKTDNYTILDINNVHDNYAILKVVINGKPNKEEINKISTEIIDKYKESKKDLEITLNLYDEKTYELDLITLGTVSYKVIDPSQPLRDNEIEDGDYMYSYMTKDKIWDIDMVPDGYIDMLKRYKFYCDARPNEVVSDEEYIQHIGNDKYNFDKSNNHMMQWMLSDASKKR